MNDLAGVPVVRFCRDSGKIGTTGRRRDKHIVSPT